jgi:hypothetical protein
MRFCNRHPGPASRPSQSERQRGAEKVAKPNDSRFARVLGDPRRRRRIGKHELICRGSSSDTDAIGVLTCESDICGRWGSPIGKSPRLFPLAYSCNVQRQVGGERSQRGPRHPRRNLRTDRKLFQTS